VLFAISAAIGGCDFLKISGANFSDVLQGAFDLVMERRDDLSVLDAVIDGDEERLLLAKPVVASLLRSASAVMLRRPRMRASAERLRNVDDVALSRALFVASYWFRNERDCRLLGFAPLCG
jgi:hypothetical protein